MDRRIVITGASSLIGQAIARKIACRGDSLLLQCFKNRFEFQEIENSAQCRCELVSVDFSNEDELKAFCKKLGEVDVLINAAACTKADLLPNLADPDIDLMIRINIKALVAICRSVLPSMLARRKGTIVNISSIAALRGNRGQSVYAGTKGFVEAFSRSLAAEYGERGIRVNSIAPGAIDAGSLKNLLSYAGEAVRKSVSSPRLGLPEDVAAVTAFLCSPDAAFINGASIPVSGGFMTGI